MKMNWNEIKEKYPKAIKRFMEWRMKNNAFNFLEKRFCVTQYGFAIESLQRKLGFQGKDIESWVCYDKHSDDDGFRFLYDFFDEQGIYIGVAFAREFGQGDYVNYWVGVVDKKIADDDYRQDYWERFDSRIETEKAVFLKAFEILENKLNENH